MISYIVFNLDTFCLSSTKVGEVRREKERTKSVLPMATSVPNMLILIPDSLRLLLITFVRRMLRESGMITSMSVVKVKLLGLFLLRNGDTLVVGNI